MYEIDIDRDKIRKQAEVEIDYHRCRNPVDVAVVQSKQDIYGILTDEEILALLNSDD